MVEPFTYVASYGGVESDFGREAILHTQVNLDAGSETKWVGVLCFGSVYVDSGHASSLAPWKPYF
ncbi:hypothetical protein HanXRQr2_Chr16g0755191 [Helianthus annuus]|uniref:Uncharacterized protein n=1 Tax=Helianthus annuus TaxID=4232 RepID=A0A251S1E6_HELAN|nr:hypothetical protein HanXRQr2_Chr16g0755191 [Helianthus annuus]KAJ0821746.1 hypothetical protein HanPSC8_Chr16g0723831 [Helianthus annuus]